MTAIGIALTVAGVAVLLPARLKKYLGVAATSKLMASTGFLITAYGSGALSGDGYGAAIFAGLVAGLFGDVFLIPKESRTAFMAGLVSFLAGHIVYAAAFLVSGPHPIVTVAAAALLGVWGAWFFRYLGVDAGSALRYGVAAYIAVIVVCTATGVGLIESPRYVWVAPGVVLFFISDIGVGLDRFQPARIPAFVWSLPAYYAGQTSLALSTGIM